MFNHLSLPCLIAELISFVVLTWPLGLMEYDTIRDAIFRERERELMYG